MTAFDEAWDSIRKKMPGHDVAQRALETGGPMASYLPYAGGKRNPQYADLMRWIYGKAGGNRRLVEPFAGALNLAFATAPEQGVFGTDLNRLLMEVVHPMVQDKPWLAEFDPAELLYQVGDEPYIPVQPGSKEAIAGNATDRLATLPPITQEAMDHAAGLGLAYGSDNDQYMMLPLKHNELRAKVNEGLAALENNTLSDRGREELTRNVIGFANSLFNGVFRYNSSDRTNSAAGGAVSGRNVEMERYSPYAHTAAENILDQDFSGMGLEELSGRKEGTSPIKLPGGIKPWAGPTMIPQKLPGGDIEPWSVAPWSDRMGGQWRFSTKNFNDFTDDVSINPEGDFLAYDPPYTEETGQHIWSDKDARQVQAHQVDEGLRGTPSVQFNAATPRTLGIIEDAGLPLSILLSRLDNVGGAGAKRTSKPESVVLQNIPGLDKNWFQQFMRERGETSDDPRYERMTDWEGGVPRMNQESLRSELPEGTSQNWWVENDPTKLGWYRKLMQERAEAGI